MEKQRRFRLFSLSSFFSSFFFLVLNPGNPNQKSTSGALESEAKPSCQKPPLPDVVRRLRRRFRRERRRPGETLEPPRKKRKRTLRELRTRGRGGGSVRREDGDSCCFLLGGCCRTALAEEGGGGSGHLQPGLTARGGGGEAEKVWTRGTEGGTEGRSCRVRSFGWQHHFRLPLDPPMVTCYKGGDGSRACFSEWPGWRVLLLVSTAWVCSSVRRLEC